MTNYPPAPKQLREGAILYTIAHAIFIAAHPIMEHEVAWDGPNYLRQDTMGTCGAVTFTNHALIGVFFDIHSPNSPFKPNKKDYALDDFFRGISPDLLATAKTEALNYVIEDYRNKHVPIVTSVFWSVGDALVGAEDWEAIYENGAHLLEIELLPNEAAMSAIQENFELPTKQMDLLASLFHKRISTETAIVMNKVGREVLLSEGNEGAQISEILLNTLNIFSQDATQ